MAWPRARKDIALQSADVEANGFQGRILWSDGTPAPGLEAAAGAAAPAYILIHGIGVSHRYLRRLHGQLAAVAPTYSLDLPGFAATPKPGRQLSVADYGAFIAQVLKASGISSYILVGHSMGVQFAIEAALYAPGQAQRVVLMGPVVDSRHRSLRRQGLALFLDALLRESASSNWLVVSDYFRCGPRWYLTELPVMMSYPTELRLAGINVPVLVLRGSHDQVAGGDWSLRLSRVVQQGSFVEIARAGHVVQHLRPRLVADAIKSWAARPTGAS
ncbi:alpha/beta hydrolase [Arthrobacter sp. FW306-05-C]|uniref:alpha/beta fold hydrolase n=1 Tax=unclassified Arthrobacter TaxID=235627 RepID=UPI001EF08DBF|nr:MULTISPECIES: alpha/beta hydrolase [unclassified Arthrobacter]UKA66722.1 alpha/beta hydrolase [Arthrobacter sp. FW306-05-C]UKA71038.1 alpha/beta hydrolase [Arthrobacter sp. FW306-06-A]UKA75358.1 alpha/beta hydrolase [Arthrobacter sp. FW306-07-I]